MPEDSFAEMSIHVYEEYQNQMTIGKFGDIESPKKWFKEITT